ncbi:ADP-ribosylation factor-like protein 6-interacting protein 4 [Plodia interpunctella]|uniref:ADP-ribosylation factor-like protein 6-interacting protein 4 n=1 Tax=Plodia interpunctella TaxID=58824 RepID=UPI00236802D9|nr:ADP-ribosylation factor-like protein 6-interacting protein 4 [Plodia interpunctella]
MGKEKSKKRRRSSSNNDSSSSSSSDSSREKKKLRKLKKKLKKEQKKTEKVLKKKLKEERKKLKKKHRSKSSSLSRDEHKKLEDAPADIPIELMEKSKAMAPMTKEEWEQKQSVVRRVLDEDTGRYRLIKGDGEVLEEIVSRDRHKQINKQATRADGEFFQASTIHKFL